MTPTARWWTCRNWKRRVCDMREYLPLLIAGAIIGAFTLAFIIAYASIKDKM